MLEDNEIDRREFLVAASGAAGLAGCLGGPKQNNTKGPDEQETNLNNKNSTQNNTGGSTEAEESGSGTDLPGLLEEGDADRYIGDPSYRGITEEGFENIISDPRNFDEIDPEYWVEFHNPDQQIPIDDSVINEYPALRVFEEGDYDNPFTTYMIWGEGENGKTQLEVRQAGIPDGEDGNEWEYRVSAEATWRNEPDYVEWEYPEEADVRGILEDVVESVDDVPKSIETRYSDILRGKQD